MKTKLTWFDRIMAAVTFAEANENAKAKDFVLNIVREPDKQKKCKECDADFGSELHGAEAHS
jgi:hypothetical protein